jgi:formamidopyrimidine-DNA glycosylase
VPELPDILLYIHALEPRVVGRRIEAIDLGSPFLLRSVEPRLDHATGRTIEGLRRLGKRIAFELDGGLFLVFHLMIAGRFKWSEEKPAADRKRGARPSALLTIRFAHGTLKLTEAGTVHRASLHVVDGAVALAAHELRRDPACSATLAVPDVPEPLGRREPPPVRGCTRDASRMDRQAA